MTSTTLLVGGLVLFGKSAVPPVYADKHNLLVVAGPDGNLVVVRDARGWKKRRTHILEAMQLVMGPLPPKKAEPLDVRVDEEAVVDTVVRKKITFAGRDGDRIPAYLLVPRGVKAKAPAMLCLHQTTPIGKGEPAGLGGNPNLHYALELARRGYVTLAPDYPNFGDYRFDAYAHGYASATMKGIVNHQRALDVLQSLPEVDRRRLGCIGHSLGGHNTLFLAAFDERVRVAVTSCGFTSFRRYMGGDLTGWSHNGYMPRIAAVYGKDPARMPFDFPEVLGALAPRALFVNAPTGDTNFDLTGVKECLEAAAPVYQLLGAANQIQAAHPETGHDFPAEVREQAYAFIDRALRASRQ